MTATAAPTGKGSSNATRLRRERAAEKTPAAVPSSAPRVVSLVPIAIDNLQPSPLNPRRHGFDAASLADLVASIQAQGVLQPLVVRERSGTRPEWEILAGHRRWAAAKLAGLSHVPAVMVEAGGETAALETMIVENVQREGLDPLELADAIASLQGAGLTQTKIGERLGLSQSRVAHILKLRELPDEVRQVLAGGQLSAAHAEALTKWAAFPAFAALLARVAAAEGWTAKKIGSPDFDHLDELVDEEHAEDTEMPVLYMHLRYDVLDRAKCATECPFGAYVEHTDGNYTWHMCLRPAHAKEISEQVDAERRAPKAAPDSSDLVAAARAAAHPPQAYVTVGGVAKPVPAPLPALEVGDRVRHSAFGDGSILEAKPSGVLIKPDDGGKEFWTGLNAFGGGKIVLLDEDGHASAHTPEAPPTLKIPSLQDLRYGNYEQINSRSPAECRGGTCACFGKARDYQGDLVEICTEPGRFRSLVTQATKARNAENRRRRVEAVSKIEDFVRDAVGIGVREMVVLAQAIADDANAYRPSEARFPQAWTESRHWLDGVGDELLGARSAKVALDKLAVVGNAVPLTKALVEAICRQDLAMRFAAEGGGSYGALADWYVGGGLPKRTPDDWQPPEKGKKS